jgi:ribonuclease-3
MGLKKLTHFNRQDQGLKISQIFGNTLEALVGAVYLDKGYKSTSQWVEKRILLPFMFLDELEMVDINIKNRIYGWANKSGKTVAFSAIDEELVNGRRLFTVAVLIDGEKVAEAKGYNKKDASHNAALQAVEKLGL